MTFKTLLIAAFFVTSFNLYAQDEDNDQRPPPPPYEKNREPNDQAPNGRPKDDQEQNGPGKGDGQGRTGRRPPPPVEALDACKSKTQGDKCSFNGREGKQMSGVCGSPDSSHPLACRPPRRDRQE